MFLRLCSCHLKGQTTEHKNAIALSQHVPHDADADLDIWSKVLFDGSCRIIWGDAYVSPLGDIVVPPTLGLAAASYIQQGLQYYKKKMHRTSIRHSCIFAK